MPHELAATLAPTGTLRAGVNLGNFLLVTGRTDTGDPQGVSPEMGALVAERLGVPVVPPTSVRGRNTATTVRVVTITASQTSLVA